MRPPHRPSGTSRNRETQSTQVRKKSYTNFLIELNELITIYKSPPQYMEREGKD